MVFQITENPNFMMLKGKSFFTHDGMLIAISKCRIFSKILTNFEKEVSMSVIELVRRSALNYVSVKVALSILGLAVSIPLISLWYWAFDSAYLAAFGIGPEIFSRPVFSSKLMLTWFVLGAIKPGVWIVGIVATALAVVLFGVQYRARRLVSSSTQAASAQIEVVDNQSLRMIDIVDRSITPAVYLLLTPLFILLLLLCGMVFMSNKAGKLASDQVDAYLKDGICPDTFNNKMNGCYSISDEPDNNYFIIVNEEKLVIYLSRVATLDEVAISVTVKDKSLNKKIIREYKREKLKGVKAETSSTSGATQSH
jgi:hypothetical protein